MSRGAICSYSFIARVAIGTGAIVVSMAALTNVPVPPQAGWLTRVRVKSDAAVLTGGNYDVTIWATDSGLAPNRAVFEIFRQVGVAPAGGAASARIDLNATPESSYSMEIDDDAVFPHAADFQIEIDTGGVEAANRDFRIVLEIQGDQTPASPTLTHGEHFEEIPF